MRRPVSIYRSLVSSLLLVVVLLGGALLLVSWFEARQAVETLSARAIERTLDAVESQVRLLFRPAERTLLVMRDLSRAGRLEFADTEDFVRGMAPVIERHPQVTSLMLADTRGRERMLLHAGGAWITRESRPDEWGSRTVRTERASLDAPPVRSEPDFAYDCRVRPWFEQAVDDGVRWSNPYIFATTKDVGITVSIRVPGSGGVDRVIGFDVLCDDISRFTMRLRPSDHGHAFVLTDDGRVLGLPGVPRFAERAPRVAVLLKPAAELGVPEVRDASRALANGADGADGFRFESEGDAWWAGRRLLPLSPGRTLAIGVVIPESDLLGDTHRQRMAILLATAAVLGFAALYAMRLARRYSTPMGALVRQSARIQGGDLEPGPPIPTRLREVRALASAHDRMRSGLRTLFKLERDLQIARQIQQNTFPDDLPRLDGFELDAWSEPADETGGDTYDLFGIRRAERDGVPSTLIVHGDADAALLLLADATGHGIGPALSVTQVRAMFRMGARTGEGLAEIVAAMNEQLYADLADDRFVTAWFGLLDARRHELTGFSAGQGPMLHYVRARDEFVRYGSDVPPLGILEQLPIRMRPPIRLERGDLFLVITDGFLEAKNAEREEFGQTRVEQVVRARRGDPPGGILTAIRAAVADYTGDAPADDDRTAVLIKRV